MLIPFCLLSEYYRRFGASLRKDYNMQRYHFFLIQKPFAGKKTKKIYCIGVGMPGEGAFGGRCAGVWGEMGEEKKNAVR